MRTLLPMLAIACLVTTALGQSGTPSAQKPTDTKTGGAAPTTKGDSAQPPAAPTKIAPPGEGPRPFVISPTPSEVEAAKAKLSGSVASVVKFDPTCKPRHVPAGAKGTMQVLMALAGDAVMLDPPPVKFAIERQQGALTVLGEPTFRPAERAGLAPALKGLPVYDNYAVFDVAFAVAADATPGPQRLELAIRYELINGKKGATIGTFTDRVGVDVEVVPATTEEIEGPGATAPATAPRGREPTEDVDAAPATAPVPEKVYAALPAAVAAGDDATQAADGHAPLPPPRGGGTAVLVTAGAATLAVLIFLGLRRRR